MTDCVVCQRLASGGPFFADCRDHGYVILGVSRQRDLQVPMLASVGHGEEPTDLPFAEAYARLVDAGVQRWGNAFYNDSWEQPIPGHWTSISYPLHAETGRMVPLEDSVRCRECGAEIRPSDCRLTVYKGSLCVTCPSGCKITCVGFNNLFQPLEADAVRET